MTEITISCISYKAFSFLSHIELMKVYNSMKKNNYDTTSLFLCENGFFKKPLFWRVSVSRLPVARMQDAITDSLPSLTN